MKTVVLGARPPALEALIQRRKALGLDLFDEVWEGEYHMAPAASMRHAILDAQLARLLGPLADDAGLVGSGPFNLGAPDDYRVPDRGLHRGMPAGVWAATAALIVEITSPDDETWAKLPFYAGHDVDEVLIVDPDQRSVDWFALDGDSYEPVDRSRLLNVDVATVRDAISWPPHD